MNVRRIATAMLGAGLFWLGHAPDAAPPRATRTTTAASASVIAALDRLSHRRREIAPPDPGPALIAARERASSPIAREVTATVHESEAHRAARRRYISEEADRLSPGLAAGKRDQLLALSDRNDARFRSARAAFMLGDVSEDDYIATLKQMVRDDFEETKTFLSPMEVATLEGNPDYDPFERNIPDVPGQPTYMSREEAAAIELDRTPNKAQRAREP